MNEIIINIVSFLADKPDYFMRFYNLTGIDAEQFSTRIDQREIQLALVDVLCHHTPTLLEFCAQYDVNADDVAALQSYLSKKDMVI